MARESRSSAGFSADERAAMKEYAAELKAEKQRKGAADKAALDAQDLLEKIAALADGDRETAQKVHAIVTSAAPDLAPKTWYGMPAYYRDGKAVVFFQPAGKFKARYSTLGFNDGAALDDGAMWPTSYALTTIGPAEEKQIAELVRRAAGLP
ncbi:iron chaperone [Propionicimonas sp.]|uniref:iron chaperone n=1 Tax=Propionicimonas sp. TaxID=1955623 RepID=UPI0039E4447B